MRHPYVRLNFGADKPGQRPGMAEIASAVARQIRGDESLAGCRLPPVRALAHQLGVSKNTVAAAYDELRAQALITAKGRTGIFVRTEPRLRDPNTDSDAESMTEVHLACVPLPELKPPPVALPTRQPNEDQNIALGSVFIDPALLSRAKERFNACVRSALSARRLPQFSDRQGYPPLRRAIAARLQKRGIAVSAEDIITTVGSQQALDIVSRSLATATVATENPAYHWGKALLEMNGVKTIGLSVEPFHGIDLEAWHGQLVKHRPGLVYLTTNFQNPIGYSYSSQEMRKILEWSRELNFGILEDDWGSEMLSYSQFKPSFRALGGSNILYMNSFTKKLLPALRIGFVAGNARSTPTLVQTKALTVSGLPTVLEAALFEFLDRGYYDAHLSALQDELDIRYQNCLNVLRMVMPKDVRWTSPGGGPILWLELPRRIELRTLRERLAKRRVAVQLSESAFFGRPHLHGFRIGYAFLSTEIMQKALSILAEEI